MRKYGEKLCFLALGCLLCFACKEPVPLYGTWADNRGNTLSFFDDNVFNAVIIDSMQQKKDYSGNYSIQLNALTMSCTEPSLRVVTEWDIRGNILYLDWTDDEGIKSLTLYKISN